MGQRLVITMLAASLCSTFALGGIPEKQWGIGIQLNHPFTGLSIRFFTPDGYGLEINVFPIPDTSYDPTATKTRALTVTCSAKLLYPIRLDETVKYYFGIGISTTFTLLKLEEENGANGSIQTQWLNTVLAGMGVIEVEGLWLPRLAGTFEYGLSWAPLDPLNLSFFNGGIGFHYYI